MDPIDTTWIVLGLDMETNIVNKWIIEVSQFDDA